MYKIIRVVFFLSLMAFFIYFWNTAPLKPLKMFVVMLHEISHGIGALLTGGSIQGFALGIDESGLIKSSGGFFFIIAISGYLGSIIWGVLMLRTASSGRYNRLFSFFLAAVVILFTVLPADVTLEGVDGSLEQNWARYAIGFFWGLSLLISALYAKRLNQLILYTLGFLTCMYAIFDLEDFLGGKIMFTDAGILARYLAGGMNEYTLPLAYAIAGAISMLTCFILTIYLQDAIKEIPREELSQKETAMEDFVEDEDSLEWIENMREKKIPRRKLWQW
jgi:hypothetical protein